MTAVHQSHFFQVLLEPSDSALLSHVQLVRQILRQVFVTKFRGCLRRILHNALDVRKPLYSGGTERTTNRFSIDPAPQPPPRKHKRQTGQFRPASTEIENWLRAVTRT